jgi:hypothetical protein
MVEAQGLSEALTCEGHTITVNLHGALIWTAVPLHVGLRIEIRVVLTDKRATAEVVYVDPDNPYQCGIALAKAQNIWGLSLPPEDWHEAQANSAPD